MKTPAQALVVVLVQQVVVVHTLTHYQYQVVLETLILQFNMSMLFVQRQINRAT
jgi:hypothetical protein